MRDLQARLKGKGFDWPFVHSFVLPEWWRDEMADLEANRALAEAYIARQLGFSVEELRKRKHPLSMPSVANVRFKRYKNQVDDRVRASALVAQRVATAVVRCLGEELPPFQREESAHKIRQAILRHNDYADLDSLLSLCWEYGIPVMQVAHLPRAGRPFDGMALFAGDRPVIALASRRDGPPWLAFHLAHELGHIMLQHVRPDTAPVVDGTLASETGPSTHEQKADRFACEVLTGFPEPRVKDLHVKAPRLAAIAAASGPAQGVDPGVFALIYAKSNNRWPVAQIALQHLDLDSGGQAKIAAYLGSYLERAEPSEADQRLLETLKVA